MKTLVFVVALALVLIQLGRLGVRGGATRVINALIVVDNSLYTLNWYKSSDEEIKCYFETIISGVATRLESIGDPAITVSLYDIFVIKATREAEFIKYFPNLNGDKTLHVNIGATRKEFYKWLEQPGNKYSSKDYDVVILYTSSQVGTIKVSAKLGSLCGQPTPVILVTDEGLFKSIDATAHGLGFSLGSARDGDQNSCDSNQHYIMTTRRLQMEGDVYENHLTFSKCSVDYIKRFLKSKGPRCLAKGCVGQCSGEENCGLQDAGQRYPLDEQCRFANGPDSKLCIGNYNRDQEMCKEVYCSSNATGSCEIVIPVDGTKCGVNKWCQDGECVINPTGSDSTGTCEDEDLSCEGKLLTVDGEMSCKEIQQNYSYICKHEYYSSYCCKTCQEVTD